MKLIRKINKGFILTVIVVLALTAYLINQDKQRKIEKIEIKKVCNEFIDFTNKYTLLPENMNSLDKLISQKELDAYKHELKNELKKQMIENESAIELQYNVLVSELEKNFSENKVVTEISRTLIESPIYEFEGNQVKVTIKSKVSKTEKYKDNGEEKIKQISFNTYDNQITLQKTEGKWKIIFANLQFDELGAYMNTGIGL